MGSLGAPELLIIGVVLVLLFGATRLPQTAKGLAQSLRVFRQELRDDDSSERTQPGALPQASQAEAQAPQAQPAPQAPQAQPEPRAQQAPATEPSQPRPSN